MANWPRKRARTSWETFPPYSPHGFATHLPARQTKSPATLANKEITPCVAKETIHDSYLTGTACLLVILRLLQVTVDWVVELHYGTVLRPDFDPVPRTILQQPMKEVFRPMEGNANQAWILDFRHWTPDSLWVELGFPISIVSKIPDSKPRIPHSISMANFPDSGFHGHKFPKFRNADSRTRGAQSDCVLKQSQSRVQIDTTSTQSHAV